MSPSRVATTVNIFARGATVTVVLIPADGEADAAAAQRNHSPAQTGTVGRDHRSICLKTVHSVTLLQ